MTTNNSVEESNSNLSNTVARQTTNVRPEPVSLRVRTAVKAGFHFVATVSKSSPQ